MLIHARARIALSTDMVALLLLAVASVAVAADTVVGMAAKARTEAKRWKADAALVEVIVAVQPDGTPRPGTMFNFLSPATRQGLMVSVADGKTTTMAMPVDTAALPIPERFVDLSQAVGCRVSKPARRLNVVQRPKAGFTPQRLITSRS